MNIRQSEIMELLEKRERITISEMMKLFNVSDMTIRRDLTKLEGLGFVTRVKGGVIANKHISLETSFRQKEKKHIQEKKAIAKKAVELLEDGDIIILDAGTTTLYIARELLQTNKRLTVATTSLAVANTLFNSDINVLIFGGLMRREIPDLIGPLTEKNVMEFHANKFFVGCTGIKIEEGFYNSDLNISNIEAKMVKLADKVIVVADSTKFGKKSFVKYADIDMIHTVITDSKVEDRYIQALKEKGIEVIVSE